MRPLISEFSYGYALTEEIVSYHRHKMKVAPVFPSLYKEGKDGYGYDVSIDVLGIPIFLQFKLSDYMKGRKKTKEIEHGLFTGSFYRMHLRSREKSKQHDLLLKLEKQRNHVYYVTPLFYELKTLNELYINKEIVKNSAFISPSLIGVIPDNDEHHISFKATGKQFYIFSEPRELGILPSYETVFEDLNFTESQYPWDTITSDMIRILRDSEILSDENFSLLRVRFRNQPQIQQVAYLAQVFFDSQLFVANRSN
ncbi:hypothetical protein CDG77_34260 [Nostoc sp. 'Peltigera membranacea cyanobiont' 213]|uniref:hypothetical protein n=1 Tax=Nostoc sp. 'Peltigera membranacea cyanobiont' 213 TaxID=2014530 RepID=UPI000B956571|nr:hypothetical protein [Nostoc sp. 'Peltigera membranacea cyanobiont' 213]OYD86596.1 hypothetical protein CDG77_34260 [Nostoc sp. 'Peltigera membranacea cyanobiont' 213]